MHTRDSPSRRPSCPSGRLENGEDATLGTLQHPSLRWAIESSDMLGEIIELVNYVGDSEFKHLGPP